jgi:hypothetical protein
MRLPTALPAAGAPAPIRPQLELSGPRLARALEGLVAGCEEQGGIERYVEALQAKAALFRATLDGNEPPAAGALKCVIALMATVRRRIGSWLAPGGLETLQQAIARLLEGREDTGTTDARLAAFAAAFPGDRAHRWVRDLAAEILLHVDPERYPLMCRWVWDARTQTGALREMWHAEDATVTIDVPDRYETFLVLREELAQYLARNGFFRDVVHYVDLLTAQVYAGYISEQGDSYLRTDFAAPQDPLLHTRRLLGLDGIDAEGRLRLKAVDGAATLANEPRRLN